MDTWEYRQNLLTAIEKRAQCEAKRLHTQPVRLSVRGKTVWRGKVEVFQLTGHPEAQRAFGWGVKNSKDRIEYVTVIGIPPLETALMAVKAYLASRR